MINIKTMFKGMATERGKIHYCYIKNEQKETLCKVNKNSIKTVNYFAKVDCKSCLERITQLHDFIRVAIWHSNEFFYKGLVGIKNSDWADGFGYNHINIDINLFPENLIDKNNIKEFISDSKNYIPLIKFINQYRKMKIINLKEKIWILKTDFDIEADKRREEEELLQKKKQEVKEQVEEKKETKVTLLPYMRRRMFRNRIFSKFRKGL